MKFWDRPISVSAWRWAVVVGYVLAMLIIAALALLSASAEARAPLHDCPATGSEFVYHVQARGVSCMTAEGVGHDVRIEPFGHAYDPRNPWWHCRVLFGTQGLTQADSVRVQCISTVSGARIRFTTREF